MSMSISGPRVMERRFRVTLPWPFRADFGAQQAESSDQDAAGSGDHASGHSYDDLEASLYGTLTAAKAASADMMAADGGVLCAVCMDDSLRGSAAKQLPCKHVFHEDCILPWLDIRSSCPVCRHEIEVPTDDPESPGGGPSPSPRVMERRFRISLPWPFRDDFGAQQAESSDQDQDAAGSPSGDYNNDANANASGRSYDDDLD